MTPLELIFSTLGEVATKEITVNRDAQGFDKSLDAARDGGTIAGDARRALEEQTGQGIVTPKNYLRLSSDRELKEVTEAPPSKNSEQRKTK